MSQLIKLRRKIKSITTTQKITYAMRLIAMSLYSKLGGKNDPINYYKNTLENFFYKIVKLFPEWENPILIPKDILDTTPLIIFITSSKGFCGGFNIDLIQFFKRTFLGEEHQTPTFITIGRKAANFIKEEKIGEILYNFNTLNSNNFLNITDDLVNIIVNKNHYFSSVSTYSNFFKNFFIQKPQKIAVTPLNLTKVLTDKTQIVDSDSFIWEGKPEEIIDSIATRYIRSSLLYILFQSLLAEQSARFVSMDNATSNAGKLLEQITSQYNKLRQASITRELLELSASFASFSQK